MSSRSEVVANHGQALPLPHRRETSKQIPHHLNSDENLSAAENWQQEADDDEWSAWIDSSDAEFADTTDLEQMTEYRLHEPTIQARRDSTETTTRLNTRSSGALQDLQFTLLHTSAIVDYHPNSLYSNPWDDDPPPAAPITTESRPGWESFEVEIDSVVSLSLWEAVEAGQPVQAEGDEEEPDNPWNNESRQGRIVEACSISHEPHTFDGDADGASREPPIDASRRLIIQSQRQQKHISQRQSVAPGIAQHHQPRRERMNGRMEVQSSWMERLCGPQKKD